MDSALNQSHPPYEILVIDDGSTDETPEILAGYGPSVRVIRQPNRGRSVARNVGLDQARGDAIMFLDSDDMLLPTNLETCAAALVKDTRIGVVYSDALIVNDRGDAVELYSEAMPGLRPSGMVLAELSRRCFLTVSSMVRRQCLSGVRFDTSMHCAEDYDFWRRLAGNWHFQFVDEPLMCYRHHESMTIASNRLQALNAELAVQRHIMQGREFRGLSAVERARSFCSHGAKNAILGLHETAMAYFALATRTAPFYPGGYVLGMLGLLGNRRLKYAIMKRRRMLGNQLGFNVDSTSLSLLGASQRLRDPAYKQAQAQLMAFTGRMRA